MTKKCFAAIKSAQEDMKQIEELLDDVMHSPTKAYGTAKAVKEIAAKWNNDFADVDPTWQPPEKTTAANAVGAKRLGAFVQGKVA